MLDTKLNLFLRVLVAGALTGCGIAAVPLQPASPQVARVSFFVAPKSSFVASGAFGGDMEVAAALFTVKVPEKLREAGFRVVSSRKKPHDLDVKLSGECHPGFSEQCTVTAVLSTRKGKEVDSITVDGWRYENLQTIPVHLVNRIAESEAVARYASAVSKAKAKAKAKAAEEEEDEDDDE